MPKQPSRLLSLCAHVCSIVLPLSLVAEDSTIAIFEETALEPLKGLILIDANATRFEKDVLFGMEGLYVLGLELPSDLALLEGLLAPLYFHQPFNETSLTKIKELIEEYFHKAGMTVVISLPEEPVQHGVLQLIVQRMPPETSLEKLNNEESVITNQEIQEAYEEVVAETLAVEPAEPEQVAATTEESEQLCEEPVAETLAVEPAEPEQVAATTEEFEQLCEEPVAETLAVEPAESEQVAATTEEFEQLCEEPVAETLVVEPAESEQIAITSEESAPETFVTEPTKSEQIAVAIDGSEQVCDEPIDKALAAERAKLEEAIIANEELDHQEVIVEEGKAVVSQEPKPLIEERVEQILEFSEGAKLIAAEQAIQSIAIETPKAVSETATPSAVEPEAEALTVESTQGAEGNATSEVAIVNADQPDAERLATEESAEILADENGICPIGYEPVEQEPPPAPPVAAMHHILVEDLKGLVLVDSEAQLLEGEELDAIEGICIRGFVLPSQESTFEKRINPIYLHQPLYTEKIQEIKGAIYRYFQDCHDPFILLNVPSQKISSGVLQLVVTRAKLGEKRVEGNEHFSSQMLTRYVQTKENEPINIDRLQSDLQFINRNPFRRVNMIYAPGKEKGTTDLILATEDTRPVRIYAGADNTGVFATNRQRLFSGATWGKVFGLDHVLSYQYTTSYDWSSFRSSTVQYIALLPWKHVFNVYGGYSTLHAKLPFPAMTNEGKNWQISGRYTIPWTMSYISSGECSIGFDFKSTNNTVEYSDLFINFANTVNLSQFVLEARMAKEWSRGRTEFNVSGYWSPGAMLPNESNVQYNALRPGAKNSWVYGHVSLRHLQRLPADFTLTLWLRGQMASTNLLPSEQIGIGGHDTVRGYDEHQLNMDAGLLFTAEARTPPISIISMIRKKPMKDALQLLGFVDYGYGRNHTKIVQEPNPDFLLSAGPGARYTLDPYIALRIDWGWKMHKQWLFAGGESMVHFSATLSY